MLDSMDDILMTLLMDPRVQKSKPGDLAILFSDGYVLAEIGGRVACSDMRPARYNGTKEEGIDKVLSPENVIGFAALSRDVIEYLQTKGTFKGLEDEETDTTYDRADGRQYAVF
ncbi:MAG: hypothetical protein EPN86_03740 [Nanoarchaeota archaeon]|nr:MAG: hypothetical protein EPN86_03740 [Nanoarchaeota archaeon]